MATRKTPGKKPGAKTMTNPGDRKPTSGRASLPKGGFRRRNKKSAKKRY